MDGMKGGMMCEGGWVGWRETGRKRASERLIEGGRTGRWEGETKESRESESLEQLNGGFFL